MLLTKKPLVEYLKILKKEAFRNGFLWILLLVARNKEYVDGYKDLISNWSSYDSITGEKIMFLFSGSNFDQIGVGYNYGSVGCCSKLSSIKPYEREDGLFHISRKEALKQVKLIENQTESVNKIKDYFKLSETDIPCLLMISSKPEFDTKYIFRLNDDKETAYKIINNIISISDNIISKYPKSMDPHVLAKRISKTERKFIKSRAFVQAIASKEIDLSDSAYDKIKKLEAIENRGNYLKENFDHKEISHINRYTDMLKEYPDLENRANKILEERKEKEAARKAINDYYKKCSKAFKNIERNVPC